MDVVVWDSSAAYATPSLGTPWTQYATTLPSRGSMGFSVSIGPMSRMQASASLHRSAARRTILTWWGMSPTSS
jgi:hypothetical protein